MNVVEKKMISTSYESMSKTYRVETNKFCISVDVDRNDEIKHGAPIIRKFIGQPFVNLKNWCLTRFEYCKIEEM